MLAEIVIVTYHSHVGAADELVRFAKLASARDDVTFTVVDNSEDSSDAAFLDAVPAVDRAGLRVLTRPDNPGFTGGCNHAALTSTADWVVFINPDITFTADHVDALCHTLVSAPERVASVAVSQMTGDLHHQGVSFNRAGWFMDRPVPGGRPSGLRDRAHRAVGGGGTLVGPSGGAAAYRAAVFKEFGGFHEPLLMWGEDADLALRLHLAGHVCAPLELALPHQGGHSVVGAPVSKRRAHLLARNRVLTAARLYTGPQLVLFAVFMVAVLAAKTPHMVSTGVLTANVAGVRDGVKAARAAHRSYDGPRSGLFNHPNRKDTRP